MFKYMDRFGFDAKPRLDYPAFQLAASGVYAGNRLLGPSDAIDIGRVAIGQERLRVTPLQMAEVAATVANKGELMEPRLWSKVIDPDGRVTNLDPAHQSRVMSEETAAEAQHDDAERGPGGNRDGAAVSGIDVAGKTGTAEISHRGSTTPGSSASPRRTTRRSRSPASSSTPAASAARPAGRSSRSVAEAILA